ncbi:MAG: substrate-binding domain-containing protein [Chitinispirillales bacterium]|jgi:phosphate transport system substrate-binding protein|nr:substrate-binding domain-containing protein [Chitinispirillales bacterium]
MKRRAVKLFLIAFCALATISCNKQKDAAKKQTSGIISGKITVISREEGSGTRSAFTELFEILDQNKNDIMTLDAEITNNTAVMLSSIKSNKRSIGYVSMSSLNSEVKAIEINGVEANIENAVNDTYPISRPFIIVTRNQISELAQDFIKFIMSVNGQEVVQKNGYISLYESEVFVSSYVSGKIVVVGSSSVSPLMEKLKEAYSAINENAKIEIQQTDSSAGIKAVENAICDIGMSSRALKDSEKNKGFQIQIIAKDGIAVIVNNENSINNLSKEQVKSIFKGEISKWDELK